MKNSEGLGADFFGASPDPMCVFDVETLRIVEVNEAAVGLYGYSLEEFAALSLPDLTKPDGTMATCEWARRGSDGLDHHGILRHVTKEGRCVDVDVRTQPVDWRGQRAMLAQFRDVTERVAFEAARDRHHAGLARKVAEAETTAAHFRALLAAVPGYNLVLSPDDFRILSASRDICGLLGLAAHELEGCNVCDLVEATIEGQSVRPVLEQAQATGQSGILAALRVRPPFPSGTDAAPPTAPFSAVVTPVSVTPVSDGNSKPGALVLCMAKGRDTAEGAVTAPDVPAGGPVELDTALSADELRLAREMVEDLSIRLQAAANLLDVGWWRFNPDTMEAVWSDEVRRLFRLGPDEATRLDLDAYIAMVHPEDREEARRVIVDWSVSREDRVTFEHRIVAPNGDVLNIRGMAAPFETAEGVMLIGVLQDVTAQREAEAEQRRKTGLLKMAGETARFGGWRVDLSTGRCDLSPECADLLDSPGTRWVSIEEANLFSPAEGARENMRANIHRCAYQGVPFDELVEIVTASGRNVRARAIGKPVRDEAGDIIAIEGAFQDISDYEEMRQRAFTFGERLAETLEHMDDAFVTLDSDWRFVFANAQACELMQMRSEEIVGQSVWEVFPEIVGTELETECKAAVASGKPRQIEYSFQSSGVMCRLRLYPSRDGLAIYFRDIGEERARAETLRLLEAAVAQQSDVLDITDARTDPLDWPRIVYVNPAFERVTGYSQEEVIGQTPQLLAGPLTDRAELARIKAVLESGESVRSEIINHRKDGTPFWKELEIRPIRDEDGRITHRIAVWRDITKRKEAEEALRESEERFSLIARASGDAIWDWDVKRNTIWWGDGLTKTFGHARDSAGRLPSPQDDTLPPEEREHVLAAWLANLHPGDKAKVLAAQQEFLDGEENELKLEYRFRRSDGTWALVCDYSLAIRDDEGRAVRLVGGIDDITETRQLEDRLRHAQRLEAVGQLTGGVAHDFNNLLTIVIGNAEFLSDSLEGDTQSKRMAETILMAADRGAELTSSLLAFARRQPLEPEAVDVNKALGEIDRMLRRTLLHSVELEVVPGEDVWPAEVDRGQFDTAILNLCLNARDAMPEGGRITLETANIYLDRAYSAQNDEVQSGDYVVLSVSDTGAGMDKATLHRAFEPFFTTKAAGRGNGMGLSMVWGFMKQTGGHVSLYSEPGEGTTVKLYLPRASRRTVEDERLVGGHAIVGGSEHVLVVEDDPDLREHAATVLRGLGYTVSEAATCSEALSALRNGPEVDLLFTDVVLGSGPNGQDLAEWAKADNPALRVLYTSGYTQSAIVHQGRLKEGVELLSKPYRREDLAARVRDILEKT